MDMMGGMGGGPGGSKSGSDPRKVMIPKVKMARADDAEPAEATVIKLLEHIQNNGTEQ